MFRSCSIVSISTLCIFLTMSVAPAAQDTSGVLDPENSNEARLNRPNRS